MPTGFLGETVTLPGGRTQAASGATRADLERLHPATIDGIPLAAILDHAGIELMENLAVAELQAARASLGERLGDEQPVTA